MSSVSAQKKIASALNYAVELNLRGDTPNEAVAKAAMDKNLTPEMTCRVVEAFNIAQTRAFLKVAEDKTASFPVADKKEVLKIAFMEAPLHPPQKKASPEYPDTWTGSGVLKITVPESRAKAAAWGDDPKPIQPKRDLPDLMEQVRAQRNLQKIAMEELRGEMAEAKDIFVSNMGKLANAFLGRDGNEKFGEFEAEAYSEFGREAQPIVGFAYKYAELSCGLQNPDLYVGKVYDTLDFMPQLDNVEAALAARSVFQEANQKMSALKELQDEQNSTISKLMGRVAHGSDYIEPVTSMLNKTAASKSPGDLKNVVSDIYKKIPTSYPGLDAIVGGGQDAVAKEYGNAAVDALKRERTVGMGRKEVTEIDNLRRQVILQDLLLNDSILKNQDPRLVVGAYHSLMKTAPSATLIPEVTRSVLRNSVGSQAMDAFTAEQLAKLEERLNPAPTPETK